MLFSQKIKILKERENMKINKLIIAFIAAGALFLSLNGCNEKAAQKEAAAPVTSDSTVNSTIADTEKAAAETPKDHPAH
ncbi:MAG: hypothetical protein ACD_79C00884G0002 [uncultured bacterium]|nr:MAG: hypothetical protein ACD_79C00884G0002 [uncultured bacterium]